MGIHTDSQAKGIIGASLSEPHTSRTSVHLRYNMVEHRVEWLRNRRVRNRARRTRDRAMLRWAARCNCSSPVTEGLVSLDEVTEDVAVSWLGAVI